MDPNITLALIRMLVKEDVTPDTAEHVLDELASAVDGLDEWISGGGCLPDGWTPKPHPDVYPHPLGDR